MSSTARLDSLLAQRGDYPTRSAAALAVRAGEVRIGKDGPVPTKPGTMVAEDADLIVTAKRRFVSRGGEKIETAAVALGVRVKGRDCLDIGASTGGFTDYLLQSGAETVIALDVGYGQLDERLRNHSAVDEISRYNARELRAEDLPRVPELVTMDVSFISVAKILPALRRSVGDCELLLMVKPQFELKPSAVGRGGVVRDPELRREAVRRVATVGEELGWRVAGAAFSGVPGPKGNRETFVHLLPGGAGSWESRIDEIVTAVDV